MRWGGDSGDVGVGGGDRVVLKGRYGGGGELGRSGGELGEGAGEIEARRVVRREARGARWSRGAWREDVWCGVWIRARLGVVGWLNDSVTGLLCF